MLRYEVAKTRETELREFPISEFYVSPDLLYISGVTDYNTKLIDGEEVLIKSPYLIGSEINTISTENVKRQGKLGVRLTLEVKRFTKTLYFPVYFDYDINSSYIVAFNQKKYGDYEGDYVQSSVTQSYVEYGGDISYFFQGENVSGYLINHRFYEATLYDKTVDIETYLYIENGLLTVGENTYYADFSKEGEMPELKLVKKNRDELLKFIDEYGDLKLDNVYLSDLLYPITPGMYLGDIDGRKCYVLGNGLNCACEGFDWSAESNEVAATKNDLALKEYLPQDWKRVTKFSIIKNENPQLRPDDVMYGGYRNFVNYGGENYYFTDIYDDKDNYVGYGVKIDDVFYAPKTNYGNEELYSKYHDLSYGGDTMYISHIGETLDIFSSLVTLLDGGKFIILINSENDDIQEGNFIIAKSNTKLKIRKYITEDENGKPYINYKGHRYEIDEHLFDTVNLSGVEYKLTYTDSTHATVHVNGEDLELVVDKENNTAYLDYNVYYNEGIDEQIIYVKYGINKNANYRVTPSSGVTIGDDVYKVETEYVDESEQYYVDINDYVYASLEVTEINGSSTYICYPYVDDNEIDEVEKDSIQREISSVIVDNKDSFSYELRKDVFGNKPLTVENGLAESMKATKPYTISDAYLLENKIHIYRIHKYLSFNFPLTNGVGIDLLKEDFIKNKFVDELTKNSLNGIVDMEKDVYYPVWKDSSGSFRPIQQLVFNLHFRTRDLTNWKIIEDDREFATDNTLNSNMCNWFITDYSYYEQFKGENKHRASDLIGLLNFSTNEVKNQALKIEKSFLRLSFYSTNNPQTQVLLGTSTIFLDENELLSKYLKLKGNKDLSYVNVSDFQNTSYSSFTDYTRAVEEGTDKQQLISNTVSNLTEVYNDNFLTDNLRLSSRIIVDDKYLTNSSAEGYYLYMFKEYAKKMREAKIYLKIEFNHAGVGKTIPFMIPRTNVSKYNDEGNLMLLNNAYHLRDLKRGFKMEDIYKQIYLPIRIKYDDVQNRYVYYLNDTLRIQSYSGFENISSNIMEFDLFEVKFENESLIDLECNNNNFSWGA